MKKREMILETVILGLLKEIQLSLDEGRLSSELLEGDIWVDTPDLKQSINIFIDWSSEKVVVIKAVAYDIKVNEMGHFEEDITGSETPVLNLHLLLN
jgi:hypothetical protein